MAFQHKRIIIASAAVSAASAFLVGCGGSTVTSDEVEASSSELPTVEETTVEETTEVTTTTSSALASPESSASNPAPPAAPAPSDRSAREISEIPEATPLWSDSEAYYLGAISDAGVNITGQESTLLGTAHSVCAEGAVSDATAGAVAGQLREQGRTDLPQDELVEIITVNARTTFCP